MGVRKSTYRGMLAGLALMLAALPLAPLRAEPLSITPPIASAPGVTRAVLAAPSVPEIVPATQTAPARQRSRVNVVVFGDSLGDGLWAGLYHVLRSGKRYAVIKQSKAATGFVRRDYFNWNDHISSIAAETPIDVAVVMIGTNDRQTIVEKGKRYAPFDDKWAEIYAARVDAFTKVLQETGAQVYWVGLPVMRGAAFERDMRRLDEIFAARARANGIAYVPTHALAADENGDYQAYGTNLQGRKRLLRIEDGIHFTMEGYMLLARAVGDQIEGNAPAASIATAVARETAPSPSLAARPESSTGDLPRGEVSASSVGLKTRISDLDSDVDVRPGRSDDWRWNGAVN